MSSIGRPGEDKATDILAAEAFAMPAPDPDLRHGPVVLPEDPTGVAVPHDVLAAEEFAMPAAPSEAAHTESPRGGGSRRWSAVGAAAVLLALAGLRRRRRAR